MDSITEEMTAKVVKQLEYYIYDYNSFLKELNIKDNGRISFETLSKFQAVMQSMDNKKELLTQFVKSIEFKSDLIEIDVNEKKFRPKTDKPLPEDKEELADKETTFDDHLIWWETKSPNNSGKRKSKGLLFADEVVRAPVKRRSTAHRLSHSMGRRLSRHHSDVYRIRISNLDKRSKQCDLEQIFGQYGHLTALTLNFDKEGIPDGSAIASFDDRNARKAAFIRLDGKTHNRRRLHLKFLKN